jgi:hypothetical protein
MIRINLRIVNITLNEYFTRENMDHTTAVHSDEAF